MRKSLTTVSFAALMLLTLAGAASARDLGDTWSKERFQVRARAIGVLPDVSSSVNIGGTVDASNSFMPEVDLSYYFTNNISAELIAATTQHTLKHSSGSKLGDVWALPPTLTLQYHFMPDSKFSPYAGVGLNYTFFYGEHTGASFTDLDVHNGVGYAMQAGFDYWLDANWGLNVDVKKLFLNVNATANNGAIRADVDVDPWIIGAGVSYRF